MEKSQGHIENINNQEYFIRDGKLYRASVHLPVMHDGFRCGRWQCDERMAQDWVKMIKEINHV